MPPTETPGTNEKVVVLGLGYVGLPVALAFARHHPGAIGFDIDAGRVAELVRAYDRTHEVDADVLKATSLKFTADPACLADATFIVVTVPTPIDGNLQPDLRPLRSASETIGKHLKRGTVVVYESTVYPASPKTSAARSSRRSRASPRKDFKLGYSPERINPGDREHTLERIVKVVSGEDEEDARSRRRGLRRHHHAGVHRASQHQGRRGREGDREHPARPEHRAHERARCIFDRLGIRTRDVLAAAGTKWNFLKFTPGLVGGHCIGVDPYYLTAKAESLGYHPQVILAGRRINDGMGAFVAQKLIKLLSAGDVPLKKAKVGILGLTFKENVPDIRNSKVPDIAKELRDFGIEPLIHDPHAHAAEVKHEYGFELSSMDQWRDLDAVVFAVSHKEYDELGVAGIAKFLKPSGIIVDVKSRLDAAKVPPSLSYWCL
jgi:UDP-N-acetyl-D-galactosamine dehydrogenase